MGHCPGFTPFWLTDYGVNRDIQNIGNRAVCKKTLGVSSKYAKQASHNQKIFPNSSKWWLTLRSQNLAFDARKSSN